MRGIDISRWQGEFDIMKAVKENNLKFVIIKAGGADGGLYKDRYFDDYYKQAKAAGVAVGCYFFGNATNALEAEVEFNYWKSLVAGKQFDFPMFYDVESDAMMKLGKRKLTDVIKKMCDLLEKNAFWAAIYSSTSVYDNKVYDKELKRYTHWVADWRGNKPVLASGNEVQLWQTGTAKINGIDVDNDVCYVDYFPEKIKELKLNGYGTEKKKKDTFLIACEVWAGLWGSGEYRRRVLEAKGYNYEEVQKMVNKLRKAAES